MPYKSEKIPIAQTKYDKRIKLDDDDKESIRLKYSQGQSMRSLSREFKVDRQVIRYTIFPQYKEQFYKANRERANPEYSREVLNKYARTHRKHKHELYKKGLITDNERSSDKKK